MMSQREQLEADIIDATVAAKLAELGIRRFRRKVAIDALGDPVIEITFKVFGRPEHIDLHPDLGPDLQ